MRRRLITRLALMLALAAVVYMGGRGLVEQIYPLTYQDIFLRHAQEYKLDPYLVAAMIRTESRFRPHATSREGARGLMQIMPETGRWVAGQLGIAFSPELLYDPDYNIRLGCWYMNGLLEEFGGDLVLALAAYNGGRGNVANWLKENRWNGQQATLDQIPFPETRIYVARVLRDLKWYRLIYGGKGDNHGGQAVFRR